MVLSYTDKSLMAPPVRLQVPAAHTVIFEKKKKRLNNTSTKYCPEIPDEASHLHGSMVQPYPGREEASFLLYPCEPDLELLPPSPAVGEVQWRRHNGRITSSLRITLRACCPKTLSGLHSPSPINFLFLKRMLGLRPVNRIIGRSKVVKRSRFGQ